MRRRLHLLLGFLLVATSSVTTGQARNRIGAVQTCTVGGAICSAPIDVTVVGGAKDTCRAVPTYDLIVVTPGTYDVYVQFKLSFTAASVSQDAAFAMTDGIAFVTYASGGIRKPDRSVDIDDGSGTPVPGVGRSSDGQTYTVLVHNRAGAQRTFKYVAHIESPAGHVTGCKSPDPTIANLG